jgi:hypothetical protein
MRGALCFLLIKFLVTLLLGCIVPLTLGVLVVSVLVVGKIGVGVSRLAVMRSYELRFNRKRKRE